MYEWISSIAKMAFIIAPNSIMSCTAFAFFFLFGFAALAGGVHIWCLKKNKKNEGIRSVATRQLVRQELLKISKETGVQQPVGETEEDESVDTTFEFL